MCASVCVCVCVRAQVCPCASVSVCARVQEPLTQRDTHLDNVDELLLVLHRPLDLVVVARSQVDHNVLVTEEEHDGARVVQLVPERGGEGKGGQGCQGE